MCGIVGYISNTDHLYQGAKDHFMRYALALDTLRGEDSTGIITLSKRFQINTTKTLMAGDRFVHTQEFAKKCKSGWAQIGHNRAATRGGVTVDNAHPFTFGDITLVHNGTLWRGGDSLDTFDKTLEVDSMQIALALSLADPEDAKEVLAQLDGSFALVWSDRRDESINMARNSERPLHLAFNKKKEVMWYMSDGNHLHSINKSFRDHDCRGAAVYEMDRQKILKFRKGELRPEVIKFDPFVRTVYTTYNTNNTHTKETNTNSGGKTNALDKATEAWANTLPANDGGTTKRVTSGFVPSVVKVHLQGRMRKVPNPMQNALRSELCLSPEDLLPFEPADAILREDGTYMVFGTIAMPEWGDTPWEATIHSVSKVQYNAYKNEDWLVRPIGLAPSHEFDQKNSACLCHLVHCDWNGYCEKQERESSSEDDKESDTLGSTGDILVPGPDGRMVKWPRFREQLEGGCINCGMDLENELPANLREVNDGKDLICGDCVSDLTVASMATTTTIN